MRILVADDGRDAADTLTVMLQLEGHEVSTAYDGRQAVAMALAEEHEVAILDLGMPNMDGFEAAARIRASSPQILLIALTGYTDQQTVRRGQEAGFQHHLGKPLRLSQLHSILERV